MKKTFGLLLISLVLVSCGPSTGENEIQPSSKEESQKVEIVFDIPNLLGKSFVYIQKSLGEPTISFIATELQRDMGIINTAEWTTQNITLSLDYSDNTQSVKYAFLVNDETKYNVDQLLKIGNLSQEDRSYNIVPQRAINGQSFTGLHICLAGYSNNFCR